jgi:hypothetical protein
MKRFRVLLTAVLAAGFCLAACADPASPTTAIATAPTDPPAPTPAGPTTVAAPTSEVEPAPTPTISFSGLALSFDRLSLVVPTGVASGGSGTLVPEASGEDIAPWEVAPEHIQFTLDGYLLAGKLFPPQIFIFPAQAYAELQERGSAAQSLDRLRALLAQGAMLYLYALPLVPFFLVGKSVVEYVLFISFEF